MNRDITGEGVLRASERIRGRVHKTPLLRPSAVERELGISLYMKAECLQKAGVFKVRSGWNMLLTLSPDRRKAGIVIPTIGNGGMGICSAAAELGIPAHVVLTESASSGVERRLKSAGASITVERFGTLWDDAAERARALSEAQGWYLAHPFDHPRAIEGAGTVAVEMLADRPKLDTIVVQIGGGSLIAGVALYAKLRNPEIRIIGVEAESAPAMLESVRCGRVVTLENPTTIAHGLCVKRVSEDALSIVQEHCDEIVTVSDREMRNATCFLLDACKLVVEPSGAAGFAAVANGRIADLTEDTAIILSGGNIDWEMVCPDLVRRVGRRERGNPNTVEALE